MQTLVGRFRIGTKAASWLLIGMLGSMAVSSFVPKDWEWVQTLAQLVMMFSAGMLASQHAAIWEPVPSTADSTPPDPLGPR